MPASESTVRDRTRTVRILAVGDCNTSGADGSSAGTQVSRHVAANLQAAGFDCSVQNLGRTMSTSREGVLRTQREARAADLLLLNFGLVDAWVTSLPGVYISYYPDNIFKKWARKLLKSIKRRLRSPRLRRWIPVGEVVPIREYERNIRRIIEIVRSRNSWVRCILWGTVTVPGDRIRSLKIAEYNSALQCIAADEPGTRYLDATSLIGELTTAEAYLDRVHISPIAAERIATAMAHLYQSDLENQDGQVRAA